MSGTILGRFLFLIGIFNFIILFTTQLLAETNNHDRAFDKADEKAVQIIDMKKSFKSTPNQKVHHDYYVNAGTEMGMKKGVIFTVYRNVAVNKKYQSNWKGESLQVPVGKVHIIYAKKNYSIARVLENFDESDSPVIEFRNIMIGDGVDLASAETKPIVEPVLMQVEAKKQDPKKITKKKIKKDLRKPSGSELKDKEPPRITIIR